MKIRDDDDLHVEIGSTRVLMRILNSAMYDISGHYDENNWFIPNNTTINRLYFDSHFDEWLELVRVIFGKLDEAYTYVDEKLSHPSVSIKKAPVSPTKETTDAQTTPETGCQGHCITVSGGNQEEK